MQTILMTRAEFAKIHPDYKLTAKQSQDGRAYVMQLDKNTGGSILVPVHFTD